MRRFIARCLAWAYHRIVLVWQWSYRRYPKRIHKVSARVVSLGNITWGGTGKTPLTIRVAQSLVEAGRKVAVLTRGYGQDEVQELKKHLPGVAILEGRDRVKSALEAVEKHRAEFLILDDGFQHLRLHRDLDVVMLNATEPFGPGGLIPLGTLREPLGHLSRADLFVLTKCDVGQKNVHWIRQKLNTIKPNATIFEAIHEVKGFRDGMRQRALSPGQIRGKKIGALSGIGDPSSFERTAEMLGAEIMFAARFEDHHPFKREEIDNFIRQAKAMGLTEAITTEKDFFRLKPVLEAGPAQWKDFTFWILEIEFQINDEEDFVRRCANT